MGRFIAAAAVAAALAASPAAAQTVGLAGEQPLPPPTEQRDFIQVGLGAAINSDYDGSNDYRIIPGGVLRASYRGIAIQSEGLGLSADLINTGRKVDFDLGPALTVNLNRSGNIRDDIVDLLPERDVAVEVGGIAGLTFKALTNPYDSLGARVKVTHDIAGAHESTIFNPSLSFGTPLSLTTYVGASLSAEFVGNKYADYYFSVSPAEALVSGLQPFDADGGMKDWSVGLLLGQSLSGDLRRGWGLFGLANYSRLVGDFKRSPLVRDRGSANQWFAGAGVGYTF